MAKIANLVNGVDGQGKSLYIVQTIKNGSCIFEERFYSRAEAQNWLEHSCQDCDEKNDWSL